MSRRSKSVATVGHPAVTSTALDLPGDLVPSRPKSHVEPVRLRFWDAEKQSDVLRIVAYRFVCGCGDRGRPWRTWREANAERRYHAGGHE